jgi:hypothetical protein
MDYPKSVPGVGLVDGKFVDENPATGQVGSLIPAPWGNAVTDELLNVLTEAGIQPNEANVGQLLQGLKVIFATLVSPAFSGTPTAPTPADKDNSTRVANTAFVNHAIATGTIDNANKIGGIPMRFAENIEQPYYFYGCYPGAGRVNELTLFPRTLLTFAMGQITGLGDALASKVISGTGGIKLNWSGQGGQPLWVFGGQDPSNVNVYNPANWSVNYATSAGSAGTSATSNYANGAGNADKLGGIPMRHQENADQPYYVYGRNGNTAEITLYNRGTLVAGFANQLTGAGLQGGQVGSYLLNKNHTSSEAPGAWELRGFGYDVGSGGDGGLGTRMALWQRVG